MDEFGRASWVFALAMDEEKGQLAVTESRRGREHVGFRV